MYRASGFVTIVVKVRETKRGELCKRPRVGLVRQAAVTCVNKMFVNSFVVIPKLVVSS